MRRNGRTVLVRSVRLGLAVAVVAGLVAGSATASLADGPYTINMSVHEHKGIELDPSFLVDASPCFVTTAHTTEIVNGQFHALAAGIDGDNLVAPYHFEKTVEESLVVVPNDPTLPVYTGHSTVHESNFENSPNAGFTNTITLRGADGSRLLYHENVHIVVKPTGIDLFVDNVHVQTRCG